MTLRATLSILRPARRPLTSRDFVAALAVVLAGCSGLPRPPTIAHLPSDFSGVPSVPPPAHVASIPHDRPAGAVWIDGDWVRDASMDEPGWRWREGGFVKLNPDEALAPWSAYEGADGLVYYAPSILCTMHGKGTGERTCVEAALRLHPVSKTAEAPLRAAPVDDSPLWTDPLASSSPLGDGGVPRADGSLP